MSPTPLDTQPSLPSDDSAVYEGRRLILNRIDEESGCTEILSHHHEYPDWCGQPEWNPFSDRCWDHTPGNL